MGAYGPWCTKSLCKAGLLASCSSSYPELLGPTKRPRL